ncbi:glutelin type-B 1-like [Jatropha curcas]|uniref:glutelin type-B 1-like n=1 Tax=Jatropha curcas TaxID=180498 RepID=UPI00189327E8|nr:glutelin type-B 1-like [Jatropha curcas]
MKCQTMPSSAQILSKASFFIDLSPRLPKKVYGGDGGSYLAWCPSELAMLSEGNIGAAKLALEKNGFAVPRYSDSAKVAYVLQGNGEAGIVLPEKEEKVIPIKKGDAIALPFGVVTWWYNKEDTDSTLDLNGNLTFSFPPFFLASVNRPPNYQELHFSCLFTSFSIFLSSLAVKISTSSWL